MNQNAVRSGLIIGVVGIIIALLLYIVDSALFGIWWLMIILGVFNLVLIAILGIKYRNENGGFLSFKEGYIYAVIAMTVMVVIGTGFSYILFNIVDPSLPELIADAAAENTGSMMQRFGAPEDGIDEAMEKTKQDTLDRFTIGGAIKGAGIRVLINLVICLVLAGIIKKKEPEETI